MRCEPLATTYNRELLDFSIFELELFRRTFELYKRTNLLYDFTDMLIRFKNQGIKPELDVLFVDEAQDLCALQWQIIEQLAQHSKITYIAGDDDQAIFRWSGADIEYFIDLSKQHPTKVLEQSYRVPDVIHKLANNLIKEVKTRVTKAYKPTLEKGKVEFISSIEDIDFSEGEWLVLVRNIYMINNAIEYLRLSGYTYESRYKNSNDNSGLDAAINWEKLRKGMEVEVGEIKNILSYMSKKQFTGSLPLLKSDVKLTLKDIMKHITFYKEPKIWHEMLDKIPVEDREYFIAVRRRGGSFLKKPRITVSTIHGAKGGECENVVLFTDLSIKTYNKMLQNYEDEVRVFYVGLTRAKKNLFIVQQNTNCYFSI
jgi:superfamily I DNA/RNA helicase